MTHGMAGVLTLYDKDGNPVQVSFNAGLYELNVEDEDSRSSLIEIRDLLVEIKELLLEMKESQ